MLSGLVRLVITAISVIVAAYLLPAYLSISDYQSVEGFGKLVLFAFVLAVLNALVRPVLLLFTLPLNLMTLGLFTFVVNALVFWLATSFQLGVNVNGFLGAFLAALAVSVISSVLSKVVP
jgi:putative membrane protein